jgi:hypothetical protein
MRIILVMALLLVEYSPALAYFYDGNKLVKDLREFEKAERSDPSTDCQSTGYYVGFVLGVYDTISSSLCPSGNVSIRQVATVVAQYINSRPAEWSRPAHDLVARALHRAFPCR